MQEPNFESIQDTCTDIANYAIILGMILNGDWKESQEVTSHNFYTRFINSMGLFNKKLKDYGTLDFLETGKEGVLSRLTEKFGRLKNLLKGSEGVAIVQNARTGTFTGKDDTLLVKQLHVDGLLKAPAKLGDVGYDVVVTEDTVIPPLPAMPMIVPGGVAIKIPDGYFCQIVGRSSSANKKGLLVHTATIDCGYTGQMFACVNNLTAEPITVKKGERLAQVVFFPISLFNIKAVTELPATERGDSGFGSTGR